MRVVLLVALTQADPSVVASQFAQKPGARNLAADQDEPVVIMDMGPDAMGLPVGPGPMRMGGPGLPMDMDGPVMVMEGGPGMMMDGPPMLMDGGMGPFSFGPDMLFSGDADEGMPFPMPMGLGGLPDGVTVMVTSMDEPPPRFRGRRGGASGPSGTVHMNMQMQHKLPLDDLASAFGGVFNPISVPLHKDDQRGRHHDKPKHVMDRFVHDVLGKFGLKVGRPELGGPSGPAACVNETKQFCASAGPHALHCLAEHAVDLNPECKASLKKSLPAVCKSVIEKRCNSFEEGILACLERVEPQLKGDCADSFHATMKSIAMVQKSLESGATVVSAAGKERPLVGHENDSYYDRFKEFAEALW